MNRRACFPVRMVCCYGHWPLILLTHEYKSASGNCELGRNIQWFIICMVSYYLHSLVTVCIF